MNRTALVLFCLLVLTPLHCSLANSDPGSTASLISSTYTTPEYTWDQFKSAIASGDFEAAHKCCCDQEAKGVQRFAKMNAEKRKSIIESMGKLEKLEQQENTAKFKLPRHSHGKTFYTYVYFEKENGAWKIASY